MKMKLWLSRIIASMAVSLIPMVVNAQDAVSRETVNVGVGGSSAVWIFANISYAGMRAQHSASSGWRIIAFIFGFPGTLLTLLVVAEGSERAYGIELPRRR